MTLIAAFPVHGVPVLVGDLLLTADADEGSQSFLPTVPEAAARLPETIGARVAGVTKKVHLIGTRLAVAWCGRRFVASAVIRRLYEEFSSSEATTERLTDILASFIDNQDENISIQLIGWIVDPIPRCFRWNSMWPSELFFNDADFDGSGENMFRETLNLPREARASYGHGISSPQEAAFYLLAKTSNLVAREIWTADTLANRFGYCYDIAIFDGARFRYLDQIAYFTWQVTADLMRGGHHFQFGPTLIKYSNPGEYSIVQTTHLAGPETGTHVDLVTPVHDALLGLDPATLGRQPLRSTYYCNFLRYSVGQQVITGSFVTHASDQTIMRHEVRGGLDNFSLDMARVREVLGIVA